MALADWLAAAHRKAGERQQRRRPRRPRERRANAARTPRAALVILSTSEGNGAKDLRRSREILRAS
ncbi:MAG TPA: hypothetical protein VF310_02400, partial [Vicinamibacteria bacterium]